MAVTAAALQAELGDDMKAIKVQRHVPDGGGAGTDQWYCNGGVGYTKKSKWLTTTASDSAADQAADVQTAMA